MLLGPSIFTDLPVSGAAGTDTGAEHVPGTLDCTWVLHVVIQQTLKLQGFLLF